MIRKCVELCDISAGAAQREWIDRGPNHGRLADVIANIDKCILACARSEDREMGQRLMEISRELSRLIQIL